MQGHFRYLDPVKLDTVLKRLRDNDLLVWDGEERVYQLSGAGRIALSALASEADAELGFITAQVAAGQAIGKVSAETLQHLLGRLNELQNEFDQAVLGGSEFRLRRAQNKLKSAFHWIEKGTEIMRAVTASGDLDTASYRIAQSAKPHAAHDRGLRPGTEQPRAAARASRGERAVFLGCHPGCAGWTAGRYARCCTGRFGRIPSRCSSPRRRCWTSPNTSCSSGSGKKPRPAPCRPRKRHPQPSVSRASG